MSEFGLPQRRRRCIAGNFDVELLKSYRAATTTKTLGDVVKALAMNPVIDPLFGIEMQRSEVIDHVAEDFLSTEEVRINRANKMTHTVYNAMPFPDPLDRTVRTITATCTRVSRESIVIAEHDKSGDFRRLTLRERASLQGFPISFQFYGASYSHKLRMIGNAVPPAFAYFMGHALQNHSVKKVAPLHRTGKNLKRPKPLPIETPPDRVGGRYPITRTFKFAIPSLQLKSGVRFELSNHHANASVEWRIAFYFGTSKEIKSLTLDSALGKILADAMSPSMKKAVLPYLDQATRFVKAADIGNMQSLWAHRGVGGTRAFMMLDTLDEIGALLVDVVSSQMDEAKVLVELAIFNEYDTSTAPPGLAKLARNAATIFAGLLIGSAVNPLLNDQADRSLAHRKSVIARG